MLYCLGKHFLILGQNTEAKEAFTAAAKLSPANVAVQKALNNIEAKSRMHLEQEVCPFCLQDLQIKVWFLYDTPRLLQRHCSTSTHYSIPIRKVILLTSFQQNGRAAHHNQSPKNRKLI